MATGFSRRERQIMDIVHQLGEASAAEIGTSLPNPPTSQAVRRMLQILVEKGVLEVHRRGRKNIFKPALEKKKAGLEAMLHLMKTYFGGSAAKTMAAMVDANAATMSDDEAKALIEQIQKTRQEGR